MALGCFCAALSYLSMAEATVGGLQFGVLVVAVRLFRRHHILADDCKFRWAA
jgi:hypothetical protein